MTCHHSRLLLAFRPGELAEEDRAALDSHLRGCTACALAARNESAADSAIRSALLAVPVPDGLRAKLHAHVSAKQGAAWRRKAAEMGGWVLAASLALVLTGVGTFWFTRPTTGSDQFIRVIENEQLAKEQTVSDWLTWQGLPAELPKSFEYGYHTFHGTGQVGNLNLPCVVFHNGRDSCRVYIVHAGRVNVPAGGWKDVTGSEFNIETVERGNLVYVIAYTSQTLDPFLKQAGPPV